MDYRRLALRSTYLVAALAAGGVAVTSYTAKGKPNMTFDQMYNQALKKAMSLPEAFWRPCFPTVGERDYRYKNCFTELSGSAALTMQRMGEALEQAGFKLKSRGSESGELDSRYIVENTPYSVNLTFRDTGIEWMAYHEETGLVPPREGKDQDARYALADPVDVGRQIAYELLRVGGVELKRLPSLVQPCGEATAGQATVCAKVGWTAEQAKRALGRYIVGDDPAYFQKLDGQKTFEYRDERTAERLRRQGVLQGTYNSPILLKKSTDTLYSFHDDDGWPAYTFEFQLPRRGQPGQIEIVAKRRPAVTYKP